MGLKEKAIVRGAVGFVLYSIIMTVITALISTMGASDGILRFCALDFLAYVGNDMTAFVIQYMLLGLYGTLAMGGIVVYEIEEWSLIKATLVHFCMTVTVFFGLAFFLRWFALKDIGSIAVMFLLMVVLYVFIWLMNYLEYWFQVKEINARLDAFQSAGVVK